MNAVTAPVRGKVDMVCLPIDELQVGSVCRSALEDDNGLLLLGAGTTLTTELIQGLRDRKIDQLTVQADEAESLSRKDEGATARRNAHVRPKRSTERPFSQEHPAKWPKGVPLKDNLMHRHHEPYNNARREVLRGHVKLARDQFEQIGVELCQRKMQTVEALSNLSAAFATAIVDDHDQTVADIVAAETSISLTDRSVKLSVLGMAIGTELGLDGPSILEIGTTGLLCDIGLFLMEPALSIPGRGPLDDNEVWEYRKHPVISAKCLQESSNLSHAVLSAIKQSHEQFNGSGYPFGTKGKRIHLYSRILNVADTYLRLTLGTSFRKALVPHDALLLLLHQARYGMFDATIIHAFLRVESLFPLGSQVKFGDDVIAQVIRRPVEGYAHPVLQTKDGTRIDLLQQTEAMIEPIADPACNQIRLPQSAMRNLRWNPADELLFE